MNVVTRIKLLADREGITITSLEKKIGASKGVLSRSLKNNTDIQAKWLSVIVENYPLYNSFWLLTGKGDVLNQINDIKNIDYSSCPICEEKDKVIENQAERISELKETIAILKGKCEPSGKRHSA